MDFKTGRKSTFIIEVGHIIEHYPELRRHASNLATIPGISKTTAVWILGEIGSIKRYPNPVSSPHIAAVVLELYHQPERCIPLVLHAIQIPV